MRGVAAVLFECYTSLGCGEAFRAAIRMSWELSGQATRRGHLSLPTLSLSLAFNMLTS